MTTDRTNPLRLSPMERKQLIDRMRNVRAMPQAQLTPDPIFDVSFTSLPGYRMIEAQRRVGAILNIPEPFYRMHETRAGARSRIDGRDVLNFASYDYLGINGDQRVTEAVIAAAREWGTSVSASRLTAGERAFHRELEAALAALYEAEDCLVFVSGHATNVTLLPALLGPKDLIVHDALVHNSLIVGAQHSGAHRRPFPHNDAAALDAILADCRHRYERCMIITEGMFSMDGDGPDLARLVEIKNKWGAWLMVDEAHSLGVLGASGCGIAEHCAVDPQEVDIWMGTLSKTLVGCGGYIAGSAALIDYLKYAAPGMVYSVGLPPTVAVASKCALDIMLAEPERVKSLHANGARFLATAVEAGLDVGKSWGTAITPIILGDSLRTIMLADRLLAAGVNAFPIIPPGVAEKSARLRFFISATHTFDDIDLAVDLVRSELDRLTDEGVSVSTVAAQFDV